MKFKLKIKDKEYEVEALETTEGKVKIIVEGQGFLFKEGETQKDVQVSRVSLPKRNFSEKEIQAPLAGLICESFVQEGQFIKEGQKVFLLSSMKMENEIISDFSGKVIKVLVRKNQKVEEGDTLLILK